MFIYGGTSHYLNPTLDKGGAVHIVGVSATVYNVGILNLVSGLIGAGSYREFLIAASDADINELNSWNISFGTGCAVYGISGIVRLKSGNYL